MKSKKLKRKEYQSPLAILLYIGGCFLLLEWIRPLSAVSNSDQFDVLLMYAVFCFIVSVLPIRSLFISGLKLLGLILIIDRLFIAATIGTPEWFQTTLSELMANFNHIYLRNWSQFTPVFQPLLLLVLIWLLSYLLHFWLIVINRVFWLITSTIVFITVMDTFTVYQADQAIIRVFLLTLIMLSISSYTKRMEKAQLIPNAKKWFEAIFLPCLLLLSIIIFIGYQAPKLEPVWSDPVPFIRSTAEQVTGFERGQRRVGYGEDDTTLGGSFIQDDTPIFQAEASKRHYWRIDSKDRYTGKGWVHSTDSKGIGSPDGQVRLNLSYPSQVHDLSSTITYLPDINFQKIVYPYGLTSINHPYVDLFIIDEETSHINMNLRKEEFLYESFELFYQYPEFNETELRAVQENDPSDIQSYYLQLPDTLPDRVKTLAEQVVEGEDTRYDRVVAIERYFGQGDFTYQTENIPIPEEHEDYVDQFLFDTQVGYCDNFSSAMVVMLRTLGIPARWVKGFTGGEVIENLSTDDEERYLFEVTNGNAHSWVEVYFPGIGWVSFEPTIGFDGDAIVTFEDEEEEDVEDDEEDVSVEDEAEDDEETDLIDEEDLTLPELDNDEGGGIEQSNGSITIWLIAALFIILGGIALYKWRYSIVVQLLLWKYPSFKNEQNLERAYHCLLRLLATKGIKRQPYQTLQAFARDVDAHFQTTDMRALTAYYERVLYRNELTLAEDQVLHDLWVKIIKNVA